MAESLLAPVAFAILAMAAAGYLAQRVHMPPVLGYLVAGLILSPHTIGTAYFDAHTLEGLAEAGVLVLLFLIGLELDIKRLRQTIRSTAFVLPFDVMVPMVLAGGVARLLGWDFPEAVGLGIAVSLSSTLLGERLTAGPGTRGSARRRVLGVLVSEDVAAGGLLALLAVLGSSIGTAEASQGGFGIVFELARLLFLLLLLTAGALLVVPRVLDEVARRHVHELMVLFGLGIVALWGYLGALAGSAELGAFVAGVAAAEAGSQYVTRNSLLGIRDASIAVFFFASGLATDIGPVLGAPLAAILVALVFLVSKLVVHVPTATAAGLPFPQALRTGFALGTMGEFSLILAAVAARNGLAHPQLQPTIIGAIIILLPIAAILMRSADRIVASVDRLPPGLIDRLQWLTGSLRRIKASPHQDPSRRRVALRVMVSNLLLLAGLGIALGWGSARLPDITGVSPLTVQGTYWGIGLALSLPLWRGAFRGYRDFVWMMVGLRPGERVGAGRVRILLVDSIVSVTAVLVIALVSLRVTTALPVLVAATAVAATIAILAWRRLSAFHSALEDTVTRVLGRDVEAGRLLDRLLQEYPWGVRSSAVAVPADSPVARRTVEGSRIHALTGAIVAVLHRRGREIVNPPPETLVLPGDTMVLMGDSHQLARAEALIVAHGEALRMTAQSKQATVTEVTIEEGAEWEGTTLGEADVRAATGTLVAGLWPRGAPHPQPYDPERTLRVGDRLLVIGTTLQIERARRRATTPPEPKED